MKESILREKSKEFAKQIVFLCRELKQNNVEYALINQLLRSGTSIGANIHEAQYAHGKKDFVFKLEISLKECNETDYWVELLYETQSLSDVIYRQLKNDITVLRRMLVSSVNTINKQLNNNFHEVES